MVYSTVRSGCLFLLHIAGGYTAVSVGFEADISICVGTDRTCVLEEGEGGMHTELSILSAFVGFGFGAGIVRMTDTTVLATLL